jgi:hypothetical protein
MRQIFSVRFFAAVGAVVGLLFLLTTIFATREVIEGNGDAAVGNIELHKIDLVEQVFSSSNQQFRVGDDGLAENNTEFVIDGTRSLRVVAGTPGEMLCPEFGEIGACAVVADLLGEAVVWFAVVPMGSNKTVRMPAIDTLEDGLATLVNGWQVEFAPVLDRRCSGDEFESYREFRQAFGDDFTAIFGIDERRLSAVVCRVRVPYAPEPALTGTGTTDAGTTGAGTTGADTTGADTTSTGVGVGS